MGRKKKKRKTHARPRRARPSERAPAELLSAQARRWIGLGLDVALAAVCLFFLVKSARFASRAKFLSDECFHTYIVEQVVDRGISPVRITGLYSGMPNNTHPLFHWFGAGAYLVDGRDALPYLNVVLCGAMLGLVYWLLRAWVSASAARIAVAIVLLYDVVHVCTQIFYMEMLSAATFAVAVLAVFIALRTTSWRVYFLAGVACAVTLLTKQTGYVLVPLVVVCGLGLVVLRRWRQAAGVALLAATFAVAFGVGMYALTEAPAKRFKTLYAPVERRMVPEPLRLFARLGMPACAAYDPLADLQPAGGGLAKTRSAAEEELLETFGRSPGKVLGAFRQVVGWSGLALAALCLVHLVCPRRWGGAPGATAPLALSVVLLLVGAICIRTVDQRHFISAIPVLASGVGVAVAGFGSRLRRSWRALVFIVEAAFIAGAVVAVVRVPDYRGRPEGSEWASLFGDAWPELIAAASAIRDHDPDGGGAVHSLWTSATWYYSGHPATWGSVNVPALNSVMVRAHYWGAFKPILGNGIRYFLITNWALDLRGGRVPRGYTPQFFANITRLMRLGSMRIIHPESLARDQDRLLAEGVFDRLLIQPATPSSPAVILDLSTGRAMQVPREAPPPAVIWGNKRIPHIVVEFDTEAYLNPSRARGSAGGVSGAAGR